MNKMKLLPAALMMAGLAFSATSSAHQGKYDYDRSVDSECNVNLHNGVTVTPEFVKVFDKSDTLYRIDRNGTLTINGKAVALSAENQRLAADYADGIRRAVPQAVGVANEAMELASKGVGEAMGALFGEDSEVQDKINDLLTRAKKQINEKLSQHGDEFTIAPDSLDDMDNLIDEELEKEIEEVAMNSMGSIFTMMGRAMSEGDGDFEQRMEAFGEKMEAWGDNLEKTLEAQSDRVEEQAEALCRQLKEVDKLETELQNKVPEFARYELLDMDDNHHGSHIRID